MEGTDGRNVHEGRKDGTDIKGGGGRRRGVYLNIYINIYIYMRGMFERRRSRLGTTEFCRARRNFSRIPETATGFACPWTAVDRGPRRPSPSQAQAQVPRKDRRRRPRPPRRPPSRGVVGPQNPGGRTGAQRPPVGGSPSPKNGGPRNFVGRTCDRHRPAAVGFPPHLRPVVAVPPWGTSAAPDQGCDPPPLYRRRHHR
jgi:hypothetical protein